jgi:hypothetical protein
MRFELRLLAAAALLLLVIAATCQRQALASGPAVLAGSAVLSKAKADVILGEARGGRA